MSVLSVSLRKSVTTLINVINGNLSWEESSLLNIQEKLLDRYQVSNPCCIWSRSSNPSNVAHWNPQILVSIYEVFWMCELHWGANCIYFSPLAIRLWNLRKIYSHDNYHSVLQKKNPWSNLPIPTKQSLTSLFYQEFIESLWSWQCFLISTPWQFEPLSKHCVCWNILSFFTPGNCFSAKILVSEVTPFSFCLQLRDKSQLIPLRNINNWIGQSRLSSRASVQMQ